MLKWNGDFGGDKANWNGLVQMHTCKTRTKNSKSQHFVSIIRTLTEKGQMNCLTAREMILHLSKIWSASWICVACIKLWRKD